MFSISCTKLVKALHEVPLAYEADPANNGYDCWDNNIGECPDWFYGICLYEEQDQALPCFGCVRYYTTPPSNPCVYHKEFECDGCKQCQ